MRTLLRASCLAGALACSRPAPPAAPAPVRSSSMALAQARGCMREPDALAADGGKLCGRSFCGP